MKVSISICAIFYLLFSLGLTVNTHYCGGKLQSISFVNTIKECAKCGSKKMQGCCKDISQTFQIDNDHQSKESVKLVLNSAENSKDIFSELCSVIYANSFKITSSFSNYIFDSFSSYRAAIFIYNCSLLI